jgi:hypothetical protein
VVSLRLLENTSALENPQTADPIILKHAPDKVIDGAPCELLADGRALCSVPMESTSIHSLRLAQGEPQKPKALGLANKIETSLYTLTLDVKTGAIASLISRKSGRELLGSQANTIIAERPTKKANDPADILPPIP